MPDDARQAAARDGGLPEGHPRRGMQYLDSIVDAVGNTPLVRVQNMTKGIRATVLVKAEYLNPGGSVKDRIGRVIIEDYERRGLIKPGGTIVESTSGNTGVGLAMVAAIKGYRCIFTMPDKMSRQKIDLLKAYGAEVVVCPTAVPPESPESYYEVAKRIVRETPGAVLANQYYNESNPYAHYVTTGPEIWHQTAGKITHFVASMGTGGTISGTAKYLKEQNPKVRVIGADPVGSILKQYFETGKKGIAYPYKVEGIGEDIIPGTTHFEYIDEIRAVTDQQSLNTARRISREEGILSGGSCGTAMWVALEVAREQDENAVVVVVLPDTGERYLSKVYNDEWMRDNRLLDQSVIRVSEVLREKAGSTPKLVTVDYNDSVRRALQLIRQHDVSQMPVVQDGRIVGAVSEATLVTAAIEDHARLDGKVGAVMEPPLPTVRGDETLETVTKLLATRNSAVLIEERGDVAGIVTRFDLIEYLAT
jgi:cystathionine beta-synthase